MSTTTPMYTKVPDGMSYINALYALYQNAQNHADEKLNADRLASRIGLAENLDSFAIEDRLQHLATRTNDYMKDFFKTLGRHSGHTPLVDYLGCYRIKTDFTNFPFLITDRYDSIYGLGAAKKALET